MALPLARKGKRPTLTSKPAAFDAARFRARFEAKGRFAAYLRAIPTWLVVAPTPALTGAALALDNEDTPRRAEGDPLD